MLEEGGVWTVAVVTKHMIANTLRRFLKYDKHLCDKTAATLYLMADIYCVL